MGLSSGVFTTTAIERVVWGRPAAAALAEEVERLGARRVFLLASGSLNRASDEVAKVQRALGARLAGTHDRMPAHAPLEAVLEAAAAARAAEADLIVTFGGGSLTDAGKIVQIALRHGITEVDGLEPFHVVVGEDGKRRVPRFEGPRARQVTIPTTLAGGEFNFQGTGTDMRIPAKKAFRHPLLVPRAIVFDPAPTVHTPDWLWLSSGMRAIDHCVEALCSVSANPYCDAFVTHAIKLLQDGLRRTKADPADLGPRLDCQFGTWLSMTGRQSGVEMGASHGIGHVLGGTCGVAHGYCTCVTLPSVLRYNREATRERQALIAGLMGRPGAEAADVVEDFIAELGLPRRLSEVGVGRDRFARVAELSMHDPLIHSNPRPLRGPEDVVAILEMAA
ncbi:MAG: iron-containing alcohol dehydrogenase [Proteobacteria bacterium]|nr:iron-containing alcohol dehydrogenase [Pseudomonadota bacterium]